MEMEDGGQYECQATTHPPQSIFVNLRVVGEWRPFFEARTEINSVSEYICNTINLSVQNLSSVLTQIVGLNLLTNCKPVPSQTRLRVPTKMTNPDKQHSSCVCRDHWNERQSFQQRLSTSTCLCSHSGHIQAGLHLLVRRDSRRVC